MRTNYYVYALINPKTNKIFYIGKGTGNRCKQHLVDKKEYCANKRLNGYIRNLIEDKTLPNIIKLHENLDEETSYQYEEKLISFYGRKGIDENGILLNILESARPPCFSGENHPWWGRKHSEETKRKISESKRKNMNARKGRPQTEETKRKISEANKGRKRSQEAIEKTRIANLGRSQTEYQKQKAREAIQKTWKITTPEGEELVITNLRQFSLDNGLDPSNMLHAAKGRIKQHKGYKVQKLD